jgi:hypothetical protein
MVLSTLRQNKNWVGFRVPPHLKKMKTLSTPRKFLLALLLLPALLAAATVPAAGATSGSLPPPATESAYVCPSGKNPYDIHLWLHVSKWCIDPAVRKQLEIKVQMEIHNRDKRHWLDIHQDKIRLVVHGFDRDRWTPPRIGSPTLDRPIRTTYAGERVWAIPANAERAYDPLPHQPGIGTFATHWHGTRLGPGDTFVPHKHYGDLVFYLPVPEHRFRPVITRDIIGIAYVKNADIIALCPPSKWEEHVSSGEF